MAQWVKSEEHNYITNKSSMQTASRVYQQMTKWPQRTGEPKPVRGTEPCWLQRPFCPISLKLQQYNSAQGNVPPEPFQLVPDPNLYAASGPCKSPREQQCTIFSHPRTSVPPTDVSHAFSSIPSTRCDTCGSHSMYVCKVSEQMNEQKISKEKMVLPLTLLNQNAAA